MYFDLLFQRFFEIGHFIFHSPEISYWSAMNLIHSLVLGLRWQKQDRLRWIK